MRIVIATTLWRRPEIEALTLERLHSVAVLDRQHTAELVAIGSEDEDGTNPRKRAEAAGFTYFDRPNSPLGAKHQAILEVVKTWQIDGVLIMGSDNWLDDGALTQYAAALEREQADVLGVLDCYFVNTRDGRTMHWPGYRPNTPRHGESIGAGRLYTREALEHVGWELWDRNANAGLDRGATQRLHAAGAKMVAKPQHELDVRLIDLKSKVNLWSFKHFVAIGRRVSTEEVLQRFPASEINALTRAFPTMLRRGDFR